MFIATETWLVPVEGWFVDRFGPRLRLWPSAVSSLLLPGHWIRSPAPCCNYTSPRPLVVSAPVPSTALASAMRSNGSRIGAALPPVWPREEFGAGTAATVVPIRDLILAYGYEAAFLYFGLVQELVVLMLSGFLRAPQPGETAKPDARLMQALRNSTPPEMLKSPVFWLLYMMFVMVAASGLMATAQIAPIAKDFNLASDEVTILFFTATTLSTALVIDNIFNGLARPFFGWISDLISSENTMAIVFTLGALAYWGLGEFGHTPYMFIVMAGLIFFTWGEIFSLFPSTCTDTFGVKYATTNAGLLYTAKGVSAWVVPLTSLLKNYSGHWHWVFATASIVTDLIVATLALFVLKPIRRRATAQG